jgi:nitroreductase
MGFVELARSRFSVRDFEDRPVEEEKLTQLLEAARLAPSAANRQPVRLIVIRTEGRESELRRVYDRDWFVAAPVLVCACLVPAQAWVRVDGRRYHDFDAALAVDHLMLAATELGLGSCWVAAFDPAAAREVLGIPMDVEPVAFAAVGYPAADPPPKERRPLSQFVRYDIW